MRKILIAGGTGFVGRYLSAFLKERGYGVTVLSRQASLKRGVKLPDKVELVTLEQLPSLSFDCVVNLAGAGILDRPWTKNRMTELFDSRVKYSRTLFDKFNECSNKPSLLINASAIGYYGFWEDQHLDEDSDFREGVVHQLCHQWEQVAHASGIENVSVLRFGVVLGRGGGALSRMLLPFKLGLGGPIGDGQQWMSWIHINDVVEVILKIIEGEIKPQTLNLTAPNPIRQKDFAKALAQTLNRPCFFPTPRFVLKLVFAGGADLLTKSQRVNSKVLRDIGYEFKFENVDEALREVISGG